VGADPVYVRARGADAYIRFTVADDDALRRAFDASGRRPVWDL